MDSTNKAWTLRLAPLGVPIVICTDDMALLMATNAAYADWRVEDLAEGPILALTLERGAGLGSAATAEIRVEGQRLTLSGPDLAGHADAETGRAHCIVPPRLCDDPAALTAEALDTLLLFLLARSGRTPVHAAGVMLGETALVLAGPSGAGKSTLSLAALARGLQILSDDTVYIQLQPQLRVWGLRRPLHVFPADAPRFTQGARLRGGKLKAAVPVPPEAAAAFADRAVLIWLDRGDRIALSPLGAGSGRVGDGRLDPGFDLLAQESAAALAALGRGGAYRLTLTDDPGAAIDFLCDRFAEAVGR